MTPLARFRDEMPSTMRRPRLHISTLILATCTSKTVPPLAIGLRRARSSARPARAARLVEQDLRAQQDRQDRKAPLAYKVRRGQPGLQGRPARQALRGRPDHQVQPAMSPARPARPAQQVHLGRQAPAARAAQQGWRVQPEQPARRALPAQRVRKVLRVQQGPPARRALPAQAVQPALFRGRLVQLAPLVLQGPLGRRAQA